MKQEKAFCQRDAFTAPQDERGAILWKQEKKKYQKSNGKGKIGTETCGEDDGWMSRKFGCQDREKRKVMEGKKLGRKEGESQSI